MKQILQTEVNSRLNVEINFVAKEIFYQCSGMAPKDSAIRVMVELNNN